MKVRLFGVEIGFSFWFFAVLCMFAVLDRDVLLVYFALPIAVHELGHLLVMLLCRVRIRAVWFTPVSLRIEKRGAALMPLGSELAVQLGGIAANLLVALGLRLFCFQSMRVMLMIAANLAVAAFNLLPVGSLDGGAVVRLLCERFFDPRFARRVSRGVSLLVLTPLFALAFALVLGRSGNYTLLLTCIYLAAVVIWRE